jgi:hypothetical protein
MEKFKKDERREKDGTIRKAYEISLIHLQVLEKVFSISRKEGISQIVIRRKSVIVGRNFSIALKKQML